MGLSMGFIVLLNLLGPVSSPVVYGIISSEGLGNLELPLGTGRRDDGCALGLGYLHGREADASGSRVDEHIVAGLDVCADHQGTVRGRGRHEEAGGLAEGPAIRHSEQRGLESADLCRVGALGSPKHAGAYGEGRRFAAGGCGDDYTGKLES